MIGWDNANWGVALNVKNITNERYFVAANGAGGLVGEGWAPSSPSATTSEAGLTAQ